MQPKTESLFLKLLLAAALLYFLISVLLRLELFVLTYDECKRAFVALNILDCFAAADFKTYCDQCLQVSLYVGSAASHIIAVFFALLGKNIFVLRLTMIAMSLSIAGCMYYVLKRWFNVQTAALCVSLLLLNYAFIQYTKLSFLFDEIPIVCLFWLSLFLGQKYLDKNRSRYLYAAAFVCGVALWTKAMFLGYMLGIGAAILLSGRMDLYRHIVKNLRPKRIIGLGLCFALGLAPLFIYNYLNDWKTFAYLWGRLTETCAVTKWDTRSVWNNTQYFSNLLYRWDQLKLLLSGSSGCSLLQDSNPLGIYVKFLLCLSSGTVLAYLFLGQAKESFPKSRIVFLIITYGVCFLLSPFSPCDGSFNHLIYLKPFPEIIIALSLGLLLEYAGGISFGLILPVLGLFAIQATDMQKYNFARSNPVPSQYVADWPTYKKMGLHLKALKSPLPILTVNRETIYLQFFTKRPLRDCAF